MSIGPTFADGLRSLLPSYDAFVIDQWGVIHDGRSLYPNALKTFHKLRESAKAVVIVTNSRKRTSQNIERLASLGLRADLYAGLISSAETLRTLLLTRPYAPWNTLGERAYVVALDEDRPLISGTQYSSVQNIENADFVILLSTPNDSSMAEHEHWMRTAASRGLTVVSSSAEPLTINSGGVFSGLADIAKKYQSYGGTVLNVGKPNSLVYDECSRLLSGIDHSRVLAIGDQFESDVVGAKLYGYQAAMVMTGAAAAAFQHAHTIDNAIAVARTLGRDAISCDILLPALGWESASLT